MSRRRKKRKKGRKRRKSCKKKCVSARKTNDYLCIEVCLSLVKVMNEGEEGEELELRRHSIKNLHLQLGHPRNKSIVFILLHLPTQHQFIDQLNQIKCQVAFLPKQVKLSNTLV